MSVGPNLVDSCGWLEYFEQRNEGDALRAIGIMRQG